MASFNGWRTSGSESWIGTREEYNALVAANKISDEIVYHVIDDGDEPIVYNVKGDGPMLLHFNDEGQLVLSY